MASKRAEEEHRVGRLFVTPELVQHSAPRGNSQRCKGAASRIIDLVWLYWSTILVGRKGVFFTCSYQDYLPSRRLEEGGEGVSSPVILTNYALQIRVVRMG